MLIFKFICFYFFDVYRGLWRYTNLKNILDIVKASVLAEYGCLKERIGEETSKQRDIIPAKIQVVKHIRPKYACTLKKEILSGPPININETPIQVFNEPNKINNTMSYMWVFPGRNPRIYRDPV